MEFDIARHQPKAEIQATFFGKVMFALAIAILVTFLGVWVGFTYFIEYFVQNPMLIWVVFGAELVLIFTSGKWSTKRPLNYWLFGLFALLSGISVTPLLLVATAMAGISIVLKALFATVLLFAATAAIGYTTKKSLANLGGFLMIALIGMIIVGVIGFFIPWGTQFEMIYSGIGVLLFSGFIVYKFNMLKHYPEDRYIDAALGLYLSLFNLFIFVLRLLMSMRD